MSLDLQEIFNKVSNHLLTQNETSYTTNGSSCAYRGNGGMKCAVGVLISDEFYDKNLEHTSVGTGAVDNAVAKSLGVNSLSDEIVLFLGKLQSIHDHVGISSWKNRLEQLANDYNLKFSPPI